ncbi:MAG: flippase [Lachnospiraceae bacterium]|nr:flippase [Butyrivibrio sp.]MCM1343404.1 flippase [Muribaculaceae bacterium]MCM1410573.1 flippase [Lachnospiraceae bacterium]
MQKKVFNNVFFSIIDKVIVFVVGTLTSIVLARYLGAADYGRYTFFGVIYSLADCFASFGMQQIVTKECAVHQNKCKSILCAAATVALPAGCITELGIIILYLSTGFLSKLEVAALGVICLFNVCSVLGYYLAATYQLKYIVQIKTIIIILIAVLYIVLVMNKAAVEWFIIVYALKECAVLAASMLAFILAGKNNDFKDQAVNGHEIFIIVKKLIRVCLPLLLAGLSVTMYMKIDQVMIKSMLGEEQLGVYSVGIKLVDAFFFIPMAIVAGVLPYFAEQHAKNTHLFWKEYERFSSMLNAFAYLYVIIMILFGKWIVGLLYGEEYAGAVGVLMVTICSVVPVCMGCVRGIYFSIMEYSKLSFAFSIITALMNMIMNYLLIPLFGILGAAIATVISYWVHGFVLTFFSTRLKQMVKVQCRSLYGFIALPKEMKKIIKKYHAGAARR